MTQALRHCLIEYTVDGIGGDCRYAEMRGETAIIAGVLGAVGD